MTRHQTLLIDIAMVLLAFALGISCDPQLARGAVPPPDPGPTPYAVRTLADRVSTYLEQTTGETPTDALCAIRDRRYACAVNTIRDDGAQVSHLLTGGRHDATIRANAPGPNGSALVLVERHRGGVRFTATQTEVSPDWPTTANDKHAPTSPTPWKNSTVRKAAIRWVHWFDASETVVGSQCYQEQRAYWCAIDVENADGETATHGLFAGRYSSRIAKQGFRETPETAYVLVTRRGPLKGGIRFEHEYGNVSTLRLHPDPYRGTGPTR